MAGDLHEMEDDALGQLRDYVELLKRNRDQELHSLRESIAVNTALTTEIKLDVGLLRRETQPLREAMQTMEVGIRTIGKIGRVGQWIGRTVLFMVALGVVLKFIFGGSSWNDVIAAFSRIMGR